MGGASWDKTTRIQEGDEPLERDLCVGALGGIRVALVFDFEIGRAHV